jgi:hypothetical protein
LNIFFITFGWVQQQTHPKVMTNMFNCPEFLFFRKEVTSLKSIL